MIFPILQEKNGRKIHFETAQRILPKSVPKWKRHPVQNPVQNPVPCNTGFCTWIKGDDLWRDHANGCRQDQYWFSKPSSQFLVCIFGQVLKQKRRNWYVTWHERINGCSQDRGRAVSRQKNTKFCSIWVCLVRDIQMNSGSSSQFLVFSF